MNTPETPFLLEVPIQQTRMEIAMEKYQIQTHDSGDRTDPGRWMAMLMPKCRKLGYGVTETSDLIDVMMKVCRIADDAGYTAYAPTEMEAVLDLCRQNQITICL